MRGTILRGCVLGDHGQLIGLADDDDHTQYHTDARAVTWLSGKSIADIGTRTHSLLGSLTADDHTQYPLLLGRAGGQTLIGGTASGNGLTLQSTSHATKGEILFGTSAYDEVNNRLGIGTVSPLQKLDVRSGDATAPIVNIYNTTSVSVAEQVVGALAFGRLHVSTDTPASRINGVNELQGSSAQGALTFSTRLASVLAEKVRITSAGNVGIGTASPATQLHISGSAPDIRQEATSGANYYHLTSDLNYSAADSWNLNFLDSVSGATLPLLQFDSPAVSKLLTVGVTGGIVSMNGNVGIGTASPTSRIHGVTTLSAATGNEIAYQLDYTTNKATSGNDTGLLINMTDTASPGTSRLLDVQRNGASQFIVSEYGNAGASSFGPWTSNPGTNGAFLYTATITNTGNQVITRIAPTYNQTSGTAANTDLLINRTQTAVGSGAQLLINAQVGGVSKFSVTNLGALVAAAGFGCNGAAAQAAYTVGAASTDLATVVALANNLRAALVANGIAVN